MSAPAEAAPRRPQWRGERQAVLVRLPVDTAAKLRAEAQQSRRSLSDLAAEFIAGGLAAGQR